MKLNTSKENNKEIKTEKPTFTVATFNIQAGKSLKGKRDISRSADAIKRVDLIGVQEVYAPSYLSLLGLGVSQARVLANTGKFDWLLCATRRRWLREHRGNLLLSKLAVSEWKIEALPDKTGKRFRNMTVAKVIWQGQEFHFINTHLHTSYGRDDQMAVVLAEFAKYSKVILVGDLNSKPSTQMLIELLKDRDISDVLGGMKIDPNEGSRLDWILTKGFKIHNAEIIEKGISDHPYYQATVSYS